MLLKIPWITKRDLKMNPHKRLLALLNFRFTVNLKFVHLLCFTQLVVRNNQDPFTVPASSQCLSRSSPRAPAVAFELQAIH